jgi:hypothetical protein
MPLDTLVSCEGFLIARENLKIFIRIYWVDIVDGKARDDF